MRVSNIGKRKKTLNTAGALLIVPFSLNLLIFAHITSHANMRLAHNRSPHSHDIFRHIKKKWCWLKNLPKNAGCP
jgi:hypothetical protein